jgi:hypothetical protein
MFTMLKNGVSHLFNVVQAYMFTMLRKWCQSPFWAYPAALRAAAVAAAAIRRTAALRAAVAAAAVYEKVDSWPQVCRKLASSWPDFFHRKKIKKIGKYLK